MGDARPGSGAARRGDEATVTTPTSNARDRQATDAGPDDDRVEVDVIVTVHDAIDDVDRCLDSLRQHTAGFELRVIVVDDASSRSTREKLQARAAAWPALELLSQSENVGYTRATNIGLGATAAEWVVLLNSDTIVTAGWLGRMIRCANSDESIGIVGPFSNAASWQSLPSVKDANGAFAVNELPAGLNVDAMARLVASASLRSYPRVPVLNGFCLLIRRRVIERVGFMDATHFPVGYGEENDYCLRAADAGFSLAVADDAFVFHAKSKSFGHDMRVELTRSGRAALASKFGAARLAAVGDQLAEHGQLLAARRRVQAALENAAPAIAAGLRVLFLLPVYGISGGASSVLREAAEMLALGVHARVAVGPEQLSEIATTYADVPRVGELLIGPTSDQLLDLAKHFDVVVATVYYTVEWAARMVAMSPSTLAAYYVQDYEPLFFREGTPEFLAAQASYGRLPDAVHIVKSAWLQRTLHERHGVCAVKVSAGLDRAMFHAVGRVESSRVRVTAMVRPQTPRRAAARTMRVLSELVERLGSIVEVHVFGCQTTDERYRMLERGFPHTAHGILRRPDVARLLRQSDVFLDLSDFQAFGRGALEAMACGCVTVIPSAGGGDEFARDGENALVVDTSDEQSCIERISSLIRNPHQVQRLRCGAVQTASTYSLSSAASSELQALTAGLRSRREPRPSPPSRRLVLVATKSRRRAMWWASVWAGAWQLPSVHQAWSVREASAWPCPGSADLAVVLCDPLNLDWHAMYVWLRSWRAAGGKAIAHIEARVEGVHRALPAGSTVRGLHWLAQVFDEIVVSEVADAHRLASLGVASKLVPLAVEPLRWRLGPASRRLSLRPRTRAPMRVGLLGSSGDPEFDLGSLRGAITKLRATDPEAVVFETVGLGAVGRRVREPSGIGADRWVAWAHRHLDWDVAIVPASNHASASVAQARLLASSMLARCVWVVQQASEELDCVAVPDCRIVSDTTEEWTSNLLGQVRDPQLLTQPADAASVPLLTLNARVDADGRAAAVLDAIYNRELAHTITPLPRELRRTALTSWTTSLRYERPPVTIASGVPKPRSKVMRKLAKLRRDPFAFFRDSRWLPVRLLQGIFR